MSLGIAREDGERPKNNGPATASCLQLFREDVGPGQARA